MSEQKRTRNEAFDVAMQALNLAQNLHYESLMMDPKLLKRRYRWFANKILLNELNEQHNRISSYTQQAYDLQALVTEWACEYPIKDD